MSNVGNDVRARAVESLQVIVTSIRRHPTAGQTAVLVGFIAGLYNGGDYPFDLTQLRRLDLKLLDACFKVLAYNCVRQDGEIHEWGEFEEAQLHAWIKREGVRGRTVA